MNVSKREEDINHYKFSHFSQDAVRKGCFQLEQPPGRGNNGCRFEEFCACDFYELSTKRQFSKDRNDSLLLHINDTINNLISQQRNFKTYCRVGQKGVCLHVCQLTILKPGSCKDASSSLCALFCIDFDIFCPFYNY